MFPLRNHPVQSGHKWFQRPGKFLQKFRTPLHSNTHFRFSMAEVETPNNFCPSIFSQMCSDLYFLQIANLDTHTCQDFLKCMSTFSFSSKRKSRHIYLSKFSQVCIDLRQKRCLDFLKCVQNSIFIKNANQDTLWKIWRDMCVEIFDLRKNANLNKLEKM